MKTPNVCRSHSTMFEFVVVREYSVGNCMAEHFWQARAQAIPHDLYTNCHEDKRGESRENVRTRLAKHPHQPVSVSITHPHQDTEQKHPCQRREEMAGIAMFKTLASLASQVGAKCDRYRNAARAHGDG